MSASYGLKRNDLCHCGSGQKYKKCHLRADQAVHSATNHSPPPTSQTYSIVSKKFWQYLFIGAFIAGLIGSYWGQSLVFAGSWVILYSIARNLFNPPQIKEDAGDPAALNFGRQK